MGGLALPAAATAKVHKQEAWTLQELMSLQPRTQGPQGCAALEARGDPSCLPQLPGRLSLWRRQLDSAWLLVSWASP